MAKTKPGPWPFEGARQRQGPLPSAVSPNNPEADGKPFDSSYDHGHPFSFVIGRGRVIKGWDEGVSTMKVGGKRRLRIPPDLGYGAKGSPPKIPENAGLLFDVELVSID